MVAFDISAKVSKIELQTYFSKKLEGQIASNLLWSNPFGKSRLADIACECLAIDY